MLVTTYDWFGYDLPIENRYRLIKEAGFDGVLMWWSELLGRNDYRNGPQIARNQGLFIENIHAPFQYQDYIWDDSTNGEASFNCYLQCIADCSEFEIPTMVLHLPDDHIPYTSLGLDRIKRLAEKAEQLRINVALENLNNFANLTYILEHVDAPRLGFCYDVCHHYRLVSDKDLLSQYGSRLFALHLHDYNENGIHMIPLDGTIDWPIAMKRIAETGYSGAITIEVMNWGYKNYSVEEFLAKAFKSAKELETFMVSRYNA